ncbi:hypothetical protein LN457_15885, partial [Xanthomonas phaseoli]
MNPSIGLVGGIHAAKGSAIGDDTALESQSVAFQKALPGLALIGKLIRHAAIPTISVVPCLQTCKPTIST